MKSTDGTRLSARSLATSAPAAAVAATSAVTLPADPVLTAPAPRSAVPTASGGIVLGLQRLLGLAPSSLDNSAPTAPGGLVTGLLGLISREVRNMFAGSAAAATAAASTAVATTGTTTKITWAWGTYPTINFNPATDKLDFGWMAPYRFAVDEVSGSTVITIVRNNHAYSLSGVSIGQLQMSNIIAKDPNTVAKWQNIISNAAPPPPPPPTVGIVDASQAEGNSGTSNMAFSVTLSKAATAPVTVSYGTSNGTATAGSDFVGASGSITFAAGESVKTINVGVVGDTVVEPDENFSVTLSNPLGASISRATAIGTIRNDDVAPPLTVSVADVSQVEGNSGMSNMAFAVTLSKAATAPVTVNYATSNVTALAGSDYAAGSGTVTFAAGETTKTINVGVIGDTTVEPDETFTVTLSNPSGASLSRATATGTITNDDVVASPAVNAKWGNSFFAPYVSMSNWPVPNLLQLSKASGASLMTIGFIQVDSNGKPSWGGYAALEPTATNDQAKAINKSIAEFKVAGGDAMVSFGGAVGTSLWQYYSAKGLGAQALANTYAGIADTYGVTNLDFDIEGGGLSDKAAVDLHSQAVRLLQQARPDLEIWYTLPVSPTGLYTDSLYAVDAALKAGVKLDGVNVMAMDYGEYAAPTSGSNAQTMGTYVIRSAQSTYNQLTTMYSKYGQTYAWSQLGVTPMLGVNDVTSEVFKVADAQALEDFARTKGIGMLSMWSLLRDNPGTFGAVSESTSGLSDPSGSFSNVFNDYGTINVVKYV
jgi:chitinase